NEHAGRRENWRRPGFPQFDGHPAVFVTWNDAKAFCAWLAKHANAKQAGGKAVALPSEAQWEYACRASTNTRYYSGDSMGSPKGFSNVAGAGYRRGCLSWGAP